MGSVGSNINFYKFSATMESKKYYGGDGQDVLEFFNKRSNYNELISSMTSEERKAFGDFVAGIFMYNKSNPVDAEDEKRLQIYDKYLNKSVINEAIEVKRLTDWKIFGKKLNLEQLQSRKGAKLFIDNHLSAAAAKEGLLMYSSYREKPVELNLQIPKGSKGAGMYIGDVRLTPSMGARQREFMINRNTRWIIGDSYYDTERGITVITLRYNGKRR